MESILHLHVSPGAQASSSPAPTQTQFIRSRFTGGHYGGWFNATPSPGRPPSPMGGVRRVTAMEGTVFHNACPAGRPSETMTAGQGSSCSAPSAQVLPLASSVLKHRHILRANGCPGCASGTSRTVLAWRRRQWWVLRGGCTEPCGLFPRRWEFHVAACATHFVMGSENPSVTGTGKTVTHRQGHPGI